MFHRTDCLWGWRLSLSQFDMWPLCPAVQQRWWKWNRNSQETRFLFFKNRYVEKMLCSRRFLRSFPQILRAKLDVKNCRGKTCNQCTWINARFVMFDLKLLDLPLLVHYRQRLQCLIGFGWLEVLVMSGCIWMEPYGGPGMLALLSLGIWAYDPWWFKGVPGWLKVGWNGTAATNVNQCWLK
jgi:hypothetical protein